MSTEQQYQDEIDALKRINRRLLNAVRWSYSHSGECLGDNPLLMEACKQLLEDAE